MGHNTFTANGEQSLNCLSQPKGQPQKLWVRRKPVHRGFECRGCGRRLHPVHDVREREIRDLPWSVYGATVIVEVHRLRCPECGVLVEKIEQLPSKAPVQQAIRRDRGGSL